MDPERQRRQWRKTLEKLSYDSDYAPEALPLALRILAQFPDDAFALEVAFNVYSQSGQHEAARKVLTETVGPDPTDVRTRFFWLSLLIAEENRAAAIDLAVRIARQERDNLQLVGQIMAYFSWATPGEARAVLERIFDDAPNGYATARLAAEIAHRMNRHYDALTLAQEALALAPQRPELQKLVADYHQAYRDHEAAAGYGGLTGWRSGQAREPYRVLLELEPNQVNWQERFALASVLDRLPVFRLYFHRFNPYSYGLWVVRPLWHFMTLLPFVVYYKNHEVPVRSGWNLTLIALAMLFIVRFTVLPLLVQIEAWRTRTGFNLFKKPWTFAYGSVYLAVWTMVLLLALADMPKKSFYLMLLATFPMNLIFFEAGRWNRNPRFRYVAYGVGGAVVAMALLSMLEILPEFYKFFVFGGWMCGIVLFALFEAGQKYKLRVIQAFAPQYDFDK